MMSWRCPDSGSLTESVHRTAAHQTSHHIGHSAHASHQGRPAQPIARVESVPGLRRCQARQALSHESPRPWPQREHAHTCERGGGIPEAPTRHGCGGQRSSRSSALGRAARRWVARRGRGAQPALVFAASSRFAFSRDHIPVARLRSVTEPHRAPKSMMSLVGLNWRRTPYSEAA